MTKEGGNVLLIHLTILSKRKRKEDREIEYSPSKLLVIYRQAKIFWRRYWHHSENLMKDLHYHVGGIPDGIIIGDLNNSNGLYLEECRKELRKVFFVPRKIFADYHFNQIKE